MAAATSCKRPAAQRLPRRCRTSASRYRSGAGEQHDDPERWARKRRAGASAIGTRGFSARRETVLGHGDGTALSSWLGLSFGGVASATTVSGGNLFVVRRTSPSPRPEAVLGRCQRHIIRAALTGLTARRRHRRLERRREFVHSSQFDLAIQPNGEGIAAAPSCSAAALSMSTARQHAAVERRHRDPAPARIGSGIVVSNGYRDRRRGPSRPALSRWMAARFTSYGAARWLANRAAAS